MTHVASVFNAVKLLARGRTPPMTKLSTTGNREPILDTVPGVQIVRIKGVYCKVEGGWVVPNHVGLESAKGIQKPGLHLVTAQLPKGARVSMRLAGDDDVMVWLALPWAQ